MSLCARFYDGVNLPCISQDGLHFQLKYIRLALVGGMCDLPATHKVCGFVSYNAYHGCNRCMKTFPTETFS